MLKHCKKSPPLNSQADVLVSFMGVGDAKGQLLGSSSQAGLRA